MESRMESTCGRVKTRRRFCPHCEDFVTKSTFYRHKSKFFDKHTKTWNHDENTGRLVDSESSSESIDESDFIERTSEDRNDLEDASICLNGSLDDNCLADPEQALEGTLEGDVCWADHRWYSIYGPTKSLGNSMEVLYTPLLST